MNKNIVMLLMLFFISLITLNNSSGYIGFTGKNFTLYSTVYDDVTYDPVGGDTNGTHWVITTLNNKNISIFNSNFTFIEERTIRNVTNFRDIHYNGSHWLALENVEKRVYVFNNNLVYESYYSIPITGYGMGYNTSHYAIVNPIGDDYVHVFTKNFTYQSNHSLLPLTISNSIVWDEVIKMWAVLNRDDHTIYFFDSDFTFSDGVINTTVFNHVSRSILYNTSNYYVVNSDQDIVSEYTGVNPELLSNIYTKCEYTDDNKLLGISIFDENNLNLLNVTLNLIIEYNPFANYYNHTFNVTKDDNFSICMNPYIYNNYLNVYINYNSSKALRYYLINDLVRSNGSTIQLYNFREDTGLSKLTAIAYTQFYQPYSNIIAKLQRYYITDNVWRTVQIDKTDEFGKALFYVYQNTVDYRILWEDNGDFLTITNPLKFICDSDTVCEQEFTVVPDSSSIDLDLGITSSFNNATKIYSFSWNEPTNTVQSMQLKVQQVASDGYVDICDSTVSSAAGTIICNVSGYSGVVRVRAFKTASPTDPVFSDTIEDITYSLNEVISTNFGTNMANILAFFISLTIMAAGLINVWAFIIFIILSLVTIFWLGLLNTVSLAMLSTAIFLGIIIYFAFKNKGEN